MPALRTHYRNLKVAENASEEDIRAAYRRLSKRYHPDYNPDDAEALRIMQIVNEAYRVLSDPEQRRLHDQWIAAQRQTAPSVLLQHTDARHQQQRQRRQFWGWLAAGILLGLLALQALWWTRTPATANPVTTDTAAASYQRPPKAPNGSPWPLYADYISGYPLLAKNGTAIATLSNPGEDRLVELQLQQDGQWQTIRTLYLPHRGHFTAYDLGPGSYRLQHRGLDSGRQAFTAAWQLEKSGDPPIYSDVSVTLPP